MQKCLVLAAQQVGSIQLKPRRYGTPPNQFDVGEHDFFPRNLTFDDMPIGDVLRQYQQERFPSLTFPTDIQSLTTNSDSENEAQVRIDVRTPHQSNSAVKKNMRVECSTTRKLATIQEVIDDDTVHVTFDDSEHKVQEVSTKSLHYSCPVCLEDIKLADLVGNSQCNHCVCKDCFILFKTNNKKCLRICCLCKQEVFTWSHCTNCMQALEKGVCSQCHTGKRIADISAAVIITNIFMIEKDLYHINLVLSDSYNSPLYPQYAVHEESFWFARMHPLDGLFWGLLCGTVPTNLHLKNSNNEQTFFL